MAYLLHPASFSAPAAPSADSSATGAGLIGSVRSLLQGIHASLHGEPARPYPPSSSSGRRTTPEACAGGTAGLTTQLSYSPSTHPSSGSMTRGPTAVSSSAGQAGVSTLYEANGRRASVAATASAAAGAAAATTASTAPTNAVDAAISNAELYHRAVDYADVEEVLRCPVPPVAGCPTPFAYGGVSATTVQQLPRSSPVVSGAAAAATSADRAAPPPPPLATSAHAAPPTPPLTFRCIAADADAGITIYSAPVEECPMHLMRAYAVLPCAPREVLQYMDNDVRPQWDSYIRRSALLRELPPPDIAAKAAQTFSLSSSLGTAGVALRTSTTSLAARAQQQQQQLHHHSPHAWSASPLSTAAAAGASAARGFAYEPGQRRVAIHYLETRSPVPFVQDRDFELVVAEGVLPDGTAYSKALSTPFGYHMPLDPQQSRYVRAVVLLSGLVARPLDSVTDAAALPPVLQRQRAAAQRKGQPMPSDYCVLEYIGLVHPMGMLPAVLVNVVISAQLNAMRKMQAFILRHPMSTLRPRGAAALASLSSAMAAAAAVQPTMPPLKELSVALQSASASEAQPSVPASPAAGAPEAGCTADKEGSANAQKEEARADAAKKGTGEVVDAAASPVSPPQRAGPKSVSQPWWRRRPRFLSSRL